MTRAVFRRSQVAPEAIYGTALAATHQLSGALALTNQPQRERRLEHRNSMGGSNVWTDYAYRCAGTYAGRAVTNELPFIFASSIRGDVTPAAGLWTYTQPLSTIPSLKPLTLYAGDNTQALRAAGCFIEEWTIEAQDTGAVMLNATVLGREMVTGSFDTAKVTMPGDTAKNLLSTVSIDDTSGGIGGTVLAGTVYGWRVQWNSGIAPDYTMDMALDMKDIHRDEPEITLTLTAKFNASAVAEFSAYRLLTKRYIRILNVGGYHSGTSGPRHTLTIDGCYVCTEFVPIAEERDGTTRCTLTLVAVEDAAWTAGGKKFEVTVLNTLTASDLPVV